MSQVFISYQETDKGVAKEIAKRLEAEGYTTWEYDRDKRVGQDYFEYCGDVIMECQAVLLLISPNSVGSRQVTREVFRGSEENKHFLPVLCGITYEEFKKRQPAWRQALSGIATIDMPSEGAAALIPKLVVGLNDMGIAPQNPVTRRDDQPLAGSLRIMLLYKRNAHPDEEVLCLLESEFCKQGHLVFVDRHMKAGTEWAREIEKQVRESDVVIPLLSTASVSSEMLALEVEMANETAQQKQGKPYLVPVRVNFEEPLPPTLASILDPIQYALWKGPSDDQRLVEELTQVLRHPPPPRRHRKATDGHGAVPLDSEFYIKRSSDNDLEQAVAEHECIVLVKGPRQMGKTSLLARGLQQARDAGAQVVLTDFQKFNTEEMESVAVLYRALAELIADQLELDYSPEQAWKKDRGPNVNFERFVRRDVLRKPESRLVWGMDEVDRLFGCKFASEVFGLLRSWHEARSLEPTGPWSRLSMIIVHATEPHLFIQNLNQSPFNVGAKIVLQDFTLDQVMELNRRYDSPIKGAQDVKRYYQLVGGSPYLVRRGLQELEKPDATLAAFESSADRDEGPFGDHLRRMLVLLTKDAQLSEAVRQLLQGQSRISRDAFFRLRSGGVIAGDSAEQAGFRCQVYASYLRRQLL